MPELKQCWRWERVVPDLGDNRDLDTPFYYEVKAGLSIVERQAFRDGLSSLNTEGKGEEEVVKTYADFFGQYIRLGKEPLVVEGKPIETLADYIRLVVGIGGMSNFHELIGSVNYFNSLEGGRRLFYERLSGGTAFTGSRNNGKASGRMGGP